MNEHTSCIASLWGRPRAGHWGHKDQETGLTPASRSFHHNGEGRLRPQSVPLSITVHVGAPQQVPQAKGISRNASRRGHVLAKSRLKTEEVLSNSPDLPGARDVLPGRETGAWRARMPWDIRGLDN